MKLLLLLGSGLAFGHLTQGMIQDCVSNARMPGLTPIVAAQQSKYAVATLPPKITVSVPTETAVEGRDIPIYITIACSPKDTIDLSSFSIDGVPFVVSEMQGEKVAPQSLFSPHDEEVIMVHRFKGTLPGRKSGVYTVGSIAVTVNGVVYESPVSTINVQGAINSPSLQLEAKVDGPLRVYPGQEFSLCYKIRFSKPIQLTREDLPFLTINGLLNVGSPVVTTEDNEGESVQSIIQKVRALRPGKFLVDEAVIEGMEIDVSSGEKRLLPPLFRSSVKSQEIVVHAFPDKGRPPSFDGAIGTFVWRASSLDGASVKIGQPVRIEYRVSGRGEFSSIRFPSFDQLTGLKESFWTESMPPIGDEVEGTKRFILVVRPKRLGVLEIPGFLAYSFDPVSERYVTETVAPVALTVEGSKEKEAVVIGKESGVVLCPLYDIGKKEEIDISFLQVCTLCFFLCIVGVMEYLFAEKLVQEKKVITSQKIFYEAVAKRSQGYQGLKLFKQAFFMRLWEKGFTKQIEEDPDMLNDDGVEGEVKGFLHSIDEILYRKDIAATSFVDIYAEAARLYNKLRA